MKRFAIPLSLLLALAGCAEHVTDPAAPSHSEAIHSAELAKIQAEPASPGVDLTKALDTGGPDLFGYNWIDSDEPGGPVYDWIDISSVGTPVPFASYVDDGNVGPIPLGFDFPFYGETFDEIYVSSNGWMSFTNSTLRTYSNQPLPNSDATVPENLLAPWWDDMVYDESDGNSAYYYNDGSRFILQMYVRRIAGFTPPFYQFQVILYPSGEIVFQYETLGTTLNSSTIGIQNGAKDDGLTVVHNDGSYPHEDLAILFSAWDPGSLSDAIVDAVEELNADGTLNGGQTNALTRKIEQAMRLYDDGKYGPAVAILGGFIQQVSDFYMDGILTEAQASRLIDMAERLIALIQADAVA